MKLVEVWIEGTSSLLQHRFSEAAEGDSAKQTRAVHLYSETPREAAARCVYKNNDGTLYHPGAGISRLLREAGGSHKQKGSRRSLKYVVPAGVLVTDDAVPLYLLDRKTRITDFEVDSRPIVIPSTKGRIMRHRPRHDAWSAMFHVRINDTVIDVAIVRQLLVEGGQQIGIGDFRPEKGGPFGTFALVSWEPK